MTNDIGPVTLNQVTFNAGDPAYTLTGNTLFFQAANGGGIQPTLVMNSNNPVIIGDAISYSSALTVQGTGTGIVTLNGPISGGLGPLNYQGAGTLVLGGANTYIGGTLVSSGTLLLANGAALPAGGNVNVTAGATLNTGGISNTAATATGTLTVTGGTVRIPTGTSDFYVNQLAMTGGAVDATGSTAFALHFVNPGAGITVNAGTTTWTGAGARFQNDSGGPLTVTLNGSPTLNIGLGLIGGAFSFTGSANVRLSNTGNTANIAASNAGLFSNDLSTNIGSGAFGTLGTGAVTLNGGVLTYDGPSAASAKPLTINAVGYLSVANAGANLTLNGVITESAAGSALSASGSEAAANPSTLTLTGTNTYSGPTAISGQLIVAVSSFATIGTASDAPANLQLGGSFLGRGTLLYAGTDSAPSTNRGATVFGQYANGDGGAIGVQNAGTILTWTGPITGAGSFIKTGAGTLVLNNTPNNYTGGTYVEGGTLAIGATGAVLPAGSNVTVQSGGTLSLLGYSNSSATALGTVTLTSATLAVPTGVGDYYLNQLTMTNGAVDLTGSSNFWLHFVNANAGITINAGASSWIGSGTSRIQNDTGNPITITVPDGATLNAGIILSRAGTNTSFTFDGAATFQGGNIRLSNTGNTADMTVTGIATLLTNDLSTNVGNGRFGTLGTGKITLANGYLSYDGPTAISDKPLTLSSFGSVQVVNPLANLTMNGLIDESPASSGAGFEFLGSGLAGIPSTLTLTNVNNSYSGFTLVSYQGVVAISQFGAGANSPIGASSSRLYLGSSGRGSLLYTGTDASPSTNRTLGVAGDYASGGGGAINVQNPGTTLTWSGQITNNGLLGPGLVFPGSLIKAGPGTLVLTNTTNSYTLGTYVEGGTLAVPAITIIPAGTNVTVLPGAVFDPGTGNYSGPALGTIAVNGGTLRRSVPGSQAYNFKTLSLTGGTVTDANAGGQTYVTLTGSTAIISNASSVTSTVSFSDPYSGISNFSPGPATIQVAAGSTPSGVDLDLFAALHGVDGIYSSNGPFIKTGAGVLRLNDVKGDTDANLIVAQGKLRVDDFAAVQYGSLSLTGGTLLYGGPTTTTTKAVTLDAGVSGIEVLQPGATLTWLIPLAGDGGLAVRGAGILILPTSSTYVGGTTIDGITYAVADDRRFGLPSGGVSVVNAGTLVYTSTSSTSRTYTLDTGGTLQVAAGQTLTIAGGRVNGGFLAGSGTFAVTGGTVLTGVTTFGSTPVAVTGAASFVNFTNGGPFSIAAGLATPISVTRFTNGGSGSITIGSSSLVTAADFQTYGMLSLTPGSAAAPTQLTNSGSSPLFFNGGSRTFISVPSHNGLFDAGVDLAGQNAVVAGGLLVNNGYIVDSSVAGKATIIADFGSLVKGAGFYQNTVQTVNGGKFQSGNSPGRASFGSFTFGPGGVSNYVFAIDDATGAAGPSPDARGLISGWGLVKAIDQPLGSVTTPGDFTWAAAPTHQLTVALETLLNPATVGADVAGPMDHFDPNRSYFWPAVRWTGAYTGPADAAALNVATVFDTSGFLNPIAGTFGWSLDAADRTLSLTYTPSAVPEPGAYALTAAVLTLMGLVRRRGRVVVLSVTFAAATGGTAAAQTWTGTNSGNWSNAGNWSAALVSSQDTHLTFPATASNTTMNDDIAGTFSLNSVIFAAGSPAYSLNGNALNFKSSSGFISPAIATNSANAVTIANAITLSNNLTIGGTGTGTVTLTGQISGPLSGLTYSGAGTLVLAANNTYAGSTQVSSGTLALAPGGRLSTGDLLSIGAGATFSTGGTSNTAATAVGQVGVTGGTFSAAAGSTDFFTGGLTGGLTMTGGTLDLSQAGAFTFHFYRSGGTLGVTINPSSTPSAWIGASSAVSNDTTAGPVAVSVPSGATLNISTALVGNGFSFTGAGSMRLSNPNSTAAITATNVSLSTNDLSTDVGSGPNGAFGTGAVTLAGTTLNYDGPTATSTKPFTISTGGLYLHVVNAGTDLTLNGAIGQSGTSGPAISGPASGQATLTLGGANTFSGAITVEAGVLLSVGTINDGSVAGPLGMASNATSNLYVGYLGRSDLVYTGPTASTNRGVTVSSAYVGPGTGGGGIDVQSPGTTLTWNGQITGGGTLVKAGPGTLALTNTANNYSGGTVVEGGTLAVGAPGAVLPASQPVTVQAGATLDLGPYGNGSGNAVSAVNLVGGTLRATGATNSDLYVQTLNMTGGTIDFSNSPNTRIHVTSAAGIASNAASTTATWLGSGASAIYNDYGTYLPITVAAGTTPSGIDLDAGLIFSSAGVGATFTKYGAGTLRLDNPANAGNFDVTQGNLRADSVAAFGTGTYLINGGTLAYGGPSATWAKQLNVAPIAGSAIQVLTPGSNLTLTSSIMQSTTGTALVVLGSGVPGQLSTLTLTSQTSCDSGIEVSGQAVLAFSDFSVINSSITANTFVLGYQAGRGDLLLTGTAPNYSFQGCQAYDNGHGFNLVAEVYGLYANHGGGGIGVQNAGTTLTLTGAVIGSGSFIKTGAGTLVLDNGSTIVPNSWAGTFVEGGTLIASDPTQMPLASDVTVFTGATFKPAPNNSGNILNSVSLIGGTLLLQDANAAYYIKTLKLTGGTVNAAAAGPGSTIYLTESSGIVCSASPATSTITGPDFGIQNDSGQPLTIQVSGGAISGVDLDLFAPLYYQGNIIGTDPTFVKTGAGVLRLNSLSTTASLVVNQGKLRVDNLAALGTGSLSLTGGTFQYGGPTAVTARPITLDAGLSGIEEMNAGATLTLTTPLTGGGGLAIRGAGTLVLPIGSTYTGGTTIDGITYAAADDTRFGSPSGGVSVVNAGTLVYTGTSTTTRTYTLDSGGALQVAAGQSLTVSGGHINGGFLRGPGTLAVTGGSSLTGLTTYSSAPVSVTGPATFVNFANGGPLTTAAALSTATVFTGFTNHGSGAINVGAGSQVNANDFQTYGTLTLSPGSTAAPTQLTNTGGSPLYFNGGSRTFISIPAHAGQFDAGIDLAGQNAIVAGGLFVNNGYVVDSVGAGTKTVIADFGSLVKGAGFYQNSVQTVNGGKFQSGNSPGKASFGSFTFGPGGVSNYVFAFDDATGTAGPSPDAAGHVSGWGLVTAVQRPVSSITTPGDFAFTADPSHRLTVALDTLLNPTTVGTDIAGPMADFDPTKTYSWPTVQWTGRYSGPADAAALNAATAFDTTGFANPIAGTFGWTLDAADRTLSLTYSPNAVPEPGTLALMGLASLGWWVRRRRLSTFPV
jgi:autotransporter-associated beta strand protein